MTESTTTPSHALLHEIINPPTGRERKIAQMIALVLCPRCEKYTNPITSADFNARNFPKMIADRATSVCEWCGWKLPKEERR
jgi:hypothetical protein